MKILVNDPDFKLIQIVGLHFMCMKMPHLTYKNDKGNITAINLQGLGHTTADAKITPWLVTAASTRTSYIFYEHESLSTSYIYEKLRIYDRDLALKIARGLTEVFSKQ